MTKKTTALAENQENIQDEVINTSEIPSEEKQSNNGTFRSREKQIEFARKRAQRQSSEIMKFLQNSRMSYEKTSFINKAHIIFQNLSQINDVNVLIGDSFAKNISKELNGIINAEDGIRAKINSIQKPEDIKKAIEQLEETEKIKVEIAGKLKNLNQELRNYLA